MKGIKSLFFVLLMIAGQLIADQPTDAVNGFWSEYLTYSTSSVETKHFQYNLLKFKAKFSNPHFPVQEGYVDINGRYVIVGSKIVTDPKEIQELKQKWQRLPSIADFYNLTGYVGPIGDSPYSYVNWIDQFDQYAILGGCVAPDFLSYENYNFYVIDYFGLQGAVDFLYSLRKCVGSFRVGSSCAPKTLYVMGEPNCSICHDLYLETKPYVDAGELSIHWFLTFFINDTSLGKCWAILDGRVPEGAHYPHTSEGAWNYNEENFGPDDNGGIPPINNPTCQANAKVIKNEQFFNLYSPDGTPFILYKNTDGTPSYSNGLPADIPTFINGIYVNEKFDDKK